jgi:hypothetical protein
MAQRQPPGHKLDAQVPHRHHCYPPSIADCCRLAIASLGLVRFLRNETAAGMDLEEERVISRWFGSICQVTRKQTGPYTTHDVQDGPDSIPGQS